MNKQLVELLGQEWSDYLLDDYVENLLLDLGRKVSEDRRSYKVYPESGKGIFQVFRSLPPKKIKVVVVGQDPYPDGSYHGRAFSNVEDTPKISPSLQNILYEVEDDVYNGFDIHQNPDLTRWEDQGVFLINRVLTVRAGYAGSHSHLNWQEFTTHVLVTLAQHEKNLVFMLWGNKAKSLAPILNTGEHLVLESGHPSPLSANKGYWFGNKHFSKANEYLKLKGKEQIKW